MVLRIVLSLLSLPILGCNLALPLSPGPSDAPTDPALDGGPVDSPALDVAPDMVADLLLPSEAGCPTGMTLCGGVCVDLMSDPSNCGACGDPCAGCCIGGACTPEGASCSDGDLCTYGDTCQAGTCSGTAASCDDGLICTADKCTGKLPPVECKHVLQPGYCLVGGACYKDGDVVQGCMTCDSTIDASKLVPTPACVTTLAGTPKVAGSSIGTLASVTFKGPTDLALVGSTLYVADTGNGRVVELNLSTGAATERQTNLMEPAGLMAGSAGGLYVAETGAHVVWDVPNMLSPIIVAGVPGAEGFFQNQLKKPMGLAPVPGTTSAGVSLFIVDSGNNAVRKYDNGQLSTVAGGPSLNVLTLPTDIVVHPLKAGYLVVSDTGMDRVVRVQTGTGGVSSQVGSGSSAQYLDGVNGLEAPRGLDVLTSDASLYIADSGHHRIRVSSFPGDTVTTLAGDGVQGHQDGPAAQARFDTPWGVAVDPATKKVYIADTGNHCIRLYTP